MKAIIINIPDMQSPHCQARVTKAVTGIEGLEIISLEAGKLTISLASGDNIEEVTNAIEKAGYTVSATGDN